MLPSNIGKNLLLLSCTLALTLACGKKRQTNEATEISQQSHAAESATLDIQVMGDEASRGPSYFQTSAATCATLTYDTIGGNVNLTIDFGTSNCNCSDGRMRRGKVNISYPTSGYYTIGNTAVFSTENYFVDDNEIDGTRTVSHPEQFKWTIAANATITFKNNRGVATWKSDRVRIQTEGMDTPLNLLDNVYSITGTASGITAEGRGYNLEITDALKIQLGCRYIKEGKININSAALKETAVLDYGSGECDNVATLTYRGKTKELNL